MKSVTGRLIAFAAVPLMVLAACGSDDSSEPGTDMTGETEPQPSSSGRAGDLVDVKVGSIPIFNNALLFTAVEQGFFADEGLNVELVPSTNFGAGLAAVLNGENQFSFASSVPVIAAASQGAPITWVSGAEIITEGTALDASPDAVVTDDPEIAGVLDLQNRTVAVNAQNVINSLAIQTAIAEAGGDPDSVQFVEIPYPDMLSTLEAGRVDAVAIVEPFVSAARADESLSLVEGATWTDGLPDGALIDGYFTSQDTLESDPELVASFARALDSAATFAIDDLDAVRAFLPEYVNVDAATAESANFYNYQAQIAPDQISDLSSLMLARGYIDEEVDPASIIFER